MAARSAQYEVEDYKKFVEDLTVEKEFDDDFDVDSEGAFF